MSDREKIIDIIERWHSQQGRDINGYTIWSLYDNERLADTLIENGIGDIIEWKRRAEVAERALRIAGDKFINEVCNMRAEDISDKCDYKCDTCFYDYYIRQAEREIEEERK